MTTNLGPKQVDALQEMASIGCGQALAALGKLMQRRVDMDVPEAWVGAGAGAIADFLGMLGEELVAVAVQLEGRLTGQLVLALPERDAEKLAACLGYPVDGTGWGEVAESALMESGNIVGSAFLSAIAKMVGGKLMLSPPRLARGGGKTCMNELVDRDAGSVAVATRFVSGEPPTRLEGLILVMPNPSMVAPLLGALGVS
jgi:chemotaxis protein CheC